MSYKELFTSPPAAFLASEKPFEEAEWAFLGVPLDITSTFRPGSRLGPIAIRQASLGLEVHGLLTGSDLSAISVCDLGDLHTTGGVAEVLERLELIAAEVIAAGKKLAVAGGEHTITLGSALGLGRAIGEPPKVVVFDAHLDLREELGGRRVCHATVVRRLVEEIGPERLAVVGARVASREGLRFASEAGLLIISSREVHEVGIGRVLGRLDRVLALKGPLYVSLDLDVLDPAFAPAVQTPEPFGLTPEEVLGLLLALSRRGLTAMDVVELTPAYDHGQTALLAARLLAEVMCASRRQA